MKHKNTKKMPVSETLGGNNLFPAFLNLQGRRCVVAGGGTVAQRKIMRLLECKACVVVVSPRVTRRLATLAKRGKLVWHQKPWNARYLQGAFLVFATTDDSTVNHRVAAACSRRGILVNVADNPSCCDFIVPASFRRGMLSVAVSSSGASPAFAARLCALLEQVLTDAHGELLTRLGEVRRRLHRMVPDARLRQNIFKNLSDSAILAVPVTRRRTTRTKQKAPCTLLSQD
jgi:precorrin-2 dehydrogenase/sirohydrochlorin ferrochelatase